MCKDKMFSILLQTFKRLCSLSLHKIWTYSPIQTTFRCTSIVALYCLPSVCV